MHAFRCFLPKPPTKPMKTNRLSLALACVALAAVTAHADTTLYFDDFTDVNNPDIATTNLHGTTPDTTIGTNTWIANTVWKADGTTASVNSTGADNSAFLAFTPTTGKVYTLSATLDVPTGGFSSGVWAALGFSAGTTTEGNFYADPNNTSPWILYRKGGSMTSFTGPGTGGSANHAATGTQTMTIVLNTQGSQDCRVVY